MSFSGAASKQEQLQNNGSFTHVRLTWFTIHWLTKNCRCTTQQVVPDRHYRLSLVTLCVCVCVRPPDQCFGCHVWAAASLYKTETSCHYSLVHSHHRGVPSFVTTLIIPPSHLAGLAPVFLCGEQLDPAAARRQLALRTRQTPADGGPRTRHAKYLSSRRRHMKYSSMVCITVLLNKLVEVSTSKYLLLSCTMSFILFIDNIAMITIFLTTSNILQGGRLDTSHNLSLF